MRAREVNVKTQIVHNASILNAIGVTGLQLYSFGETVSIPFFTETSELESFFDKICENKKRGLHTLCLLGEDRLYLIVCLGLFIKSSWDSVFRY